MDEAHNLRGFLRRHRHIFLDTSIFIYFVEQHPRYHLLCDHIFEAVEAGSVRASTSTLTLLEILVQPYRRKADDLVLRFYSLLQTYPNLGWVPLTLEIADLAARLRAECLPETPDSVQAASAICAGATGFVCNDADFRRVEEIECLVLEECFGA